MSKNNNILQLDKARSESARVNTNCDNCVRKSHCPVQDSAAMQLGQFTNSILHSKPTRQGQYVFTAGDKFDGIYIVQSGFFKSYILDREGDLQVTGFHFPGEVFGLEGIEEGLYNYSVKALSTGSLCKIPYSQLVQPSPDPHQSTLSLLSLMSKVIARDHKLIFALGKMNAQRRFANFLIDINERMQLSGYGGKDLMLCMKRSDMANYLGLAVETVSRLFTRFQEMGILSVHRRCLNIYDMAALHDIVNEDFSAGVLLDKVS